MAKEGGKREKFLQATVGRFKSRSRSRNSLPESPVPASGSSSTTNAVPANEILDGGFTAGPERTAQIVEMESMGFRRSKIDLAMRAAFDNSERAIEYLLNGIPENPQPEEGRLQGVIAATFPNLRAQGGEEPMVSLPQATQVAQAGNSRPENNTVTGPADFKTDNPQDSLWDRALQELREDSKTTELIVAYQSILETEADKIYCDNQQSSGQPEKFSKVIKLGMDQIEAKQWKIQLDPKHPIIVREQINRIVKTVKKFSGIFAVAASFDPVHAGAAWAGVSAILPFLLNISTQDEALISGIDFIAGRIAWYTPVEDLLLKGETKPTPKLIPAIVKVYKAIFLYQAKAAVHVRRSTFSRTSRDTVAADPWADDLKKIKDADTDCQTFVSLASTAKLSDELESIKEALFNLKMEPSVLEWLINGNHSEIETHHRVRREAGEQYQSSGAWFLRPKDGDDTYAVWRKSIRGQLSLQGSAGTGKTTLASIVVEDLVENVNHPKLAYYYCKRNISSDVDDAMRSLLSQLAYLSEHMTTLAALKSFKDNRRRRPDAEECVQLLRQTMLEAGPTVILVDGWDECEKPNSLLKHLEELWEQSTDLKLFLSSRIKLGIQSRFPQVATVTCNSDKNYDDIRFYIHAQLKNPDRRNSKVITEKLAEEMINVLLRGADGMFLWVKLQLELLISEEYPIDSAEEFQRRLDNLQEKSSGGSLDMLNQTYDDILRRNLRNQGTEASKSAKEALQWIACSGRPFNRTILVQAVKSNTKDSRSPEQLEKWCRNLFYANEMGIIRFTHSSVREYVDSQYSLAAAHMMAAQTCIGSLTKRGDREAFASYSSSYWPFHCGQAGLNQEWEKTALGNRLLALLSPKSTLRSIWEHNMKISENLGKAFTYDGTRMVADNILMACQFNWLWYLVHPVNIEGVHFQRSLMFSGGLGMHLAIKQRHQDIVRFLLARGVNTDRWNDGTPLGMAVLTNQPVMVKLLLGVDSTDLDTELVSLSSDGTEMQRSYAGVNERASFDDNTALHLAAIHNLPEIAQILCDVQNVDINIRNEKGATPLLDAAVVGSERVVRILLNHPGIDLKPIGDLPEGRLSALHCTGSPAIAKMLLDYNPKISNLATPNGWTVLGHWLKPRESTGMYADAAYERDLQARLKLLLQSEGLQSLRRNTKDLGDTKKVSALHHSAQAHSAAVFQLLYEDKRTDTEEKDESGNRLLHSATVHGNTEVVRFLLSKGVESTLKNDSGQTALMIADENQYAEIAKLLREIPS